MEEPKLINKEGQDLKLATMELDFIIAELGDDFGGGLLVAAEASPERGATLGGAAGRGVGWPETGRPGATPFTLQHAVLSVGLGPMHRLLDVVFHAQPLLVPHGHAAIPPLIIESALGRIAQGFLGILQSEIRYIKTV